MNKITRDDIETYVSNIIATWNSATVRATSGRTRVVLSSARHSRVNR